MYYLCLKICFLMFILISFNSCQKTTNNNIATVWEGSGIEFEDYYAMKKLDSLVNGKIVFSKHPSLTVYFFQSFKNPLMAIFTFVDSLIYCDIFEFEEENVSVKDRIQLSQGEKEALERQIEISKPSQLITISDLFVDDGYTCIVKNISYRYNLFSVRAHTTESKKSEQYKFIRHISRFLNSRNFNIDL